MSDELPIIDNMKSEILSSAAAERPSLPEVVYRELREAIMSGEFEPGRVLRQDEIARRFGVSRAPLREALPRLESEGIVSFNARHGYSVAELDPADVTEIFRLRAMIEQDAARSAATMRTAQDIDALRALLDTLVATTDAADPQAFQNWARVHFAFHRALLLPSRCSRHLKVVDSLRVEVESYMRANMSHTGVPRQSNDEHRLMFKAFRDGDGDELARLIGLHCEHTAERLLKYLAARGKSA